MLDYGNKNYKKKKKKKKIVTPGVGPNLTPGL